MMGWLWWVGAAVALGILEILSLDLVLIMLAGGALAGGIAYLLGASVVVQCVVAAVTAVVLLAALRPWLLRHLRHRVPLTETNAAALVGRGAVAVTAVTADGGRIKLAGEVWTARAEGEETIPEGGEVRVARIDGATAVVVPSSG